MTNITSTTSRYLIAAVAAGAALFWSGEDPLHRQAAFVSTAQAIIGAPLTPMSYAGVARRTTRRAVAVGAAVAAPVVVAPRAGCMQTVNAYGQIAYICP